MKLLLDALYFEFEGRGGVGRIFHEALPRVLDLLPELSATAFTTGHLRAPLPAHPRLETERISASAHWSKALAPGRLPWGRIPWAIRSKALASAVSGTKKALWHSTYYTLPKSWSGPSLVILYDTIHERYPELFPSDRPFLKYKAEAVRAASHVACISESARRDAIEIYEIPESSTSVLYLAAGLSQRESTAQFSPASADRPYLLFVGQRFAYKNFSGLLGAFAGWEHRGEFDLLCAGGPPFDARELAKMAALGLEGRVRHLGRLDDAALESAYRGASCLVYPSLYEGFGLPVLEAFMAGIPVALSNASSLPEVGGVAGFYFDPSDPSDQRRALSEAVGMSTRSREARVAAGRAHAALFSWERTAENLAGLYRRLS